MIEPIEIEGINFNPDFKATRIPYLKLVKPMEFFPQSQQKNDYPTYRIYSEVNIDDQGQRHLVVKTRWIKTAEGRLITDPFEIEEFKKGPTQKPQINPTFQKVQESEIPVNRLVNPWWREGWLNLRGWTKEYWKLALIGGSLGILLVGGPSWLINHQHPIGFPGPSKEKPSLAASASPSLPPGVVNYTPLGTNKVIPIKVAKYNPLVNPMFPNPDLAIGNPENWGNPNESSILGRDRALVYIVKTGDKSFNPNNPDPPHQYQAMLNFDRFFWTNPQNEALAREIDNFTHVESPATSFDFDNSDLAYHDKELVEPADISQFSSLTGHS